MTTSAAVGLPPDGGHGWVIVAASCVVYSVNGGIFFSQGFLYSEFLKEFGAGEAVTAWVCSILSGLCLLTAMAAGWLLETVGHRFMCIVGSFMVGAGFILSSFVHNLTLFFFTYSVTIGLGSGMQFMSAIMIPQLYFDKKRALATGITVSGSPAGGMIFALMVQYFITMYGLRPTMMLVGGISLNACAMGILMVPPLKLKKVPSLPDLEALEPPEPRPLARLKVDMGSVMLQSIENMKSAISLEIKETELEPKYKIYVKKLSKLFDISALKQFITLVALLNFFLFSMGYIVPFVFLPLLLSDYDIDPETTSVIFSVMAGSDFCGRIIFGALGNSQRVSSVNLHGVSALLSGTACVLAIFANGTTAFFVFAFVYGVLVGGWMTISTVSLADLLGVENLAKSFGIMQVAGSIAFFTTTPLHAVMMEVAGSRSVTFISGGILQILGGLILLLYYHTCYKNSRNYKSSLNEVEEENLADYKESAPNIVISLPTDNLKNCEFDSASDVATVA